MPRPPIPAQTQQEWRIAIREFLKSEPFSESDEQEAIQQIYKDSGYLLSNFQLEAFLNGMSLGKANLFLKEDALDKTKTKGFFEFFEGVSTLTYCCLFIVFLILLFASFSLKVSDDESGIFSFIMAGSFLILFILGWIIKERCYNPGYQVRTYSVWQRSTQGDSTGCGVVLGCILVAAGFVMLFAMPMLGLGMITFGLLLMGVFQ